MKIFESMAGGNLKMIAQDFRDIFEVGLELAHELLPSSRINTVRLEDPQRPGYLKIHRIGMDPQLPELSEGEKKLAYAERWRTDARDSYASLVWENREPILCADVRDGEKNPLYTELFKNVHSIIIAPVTDGKDVIGTLDLRTLGEDRFPKHAKDAAAILGLLLGLAYSRSTDRQAAAKATLKALRAESEQMRTQRAVHNAFSDLSHQLKGPASNLRDALGLLLQTAVGPLQYELIKLSSLARRVETYTKLIGVFGMLADGKPINRVAIPLTQEEVCAHVKSLCAEFQVRAGRRRSMSLQPDWDSISKHFPAEFLFDQDFLVQCLYNLLDNAVKYGDKGSVIEIKAGWQTTGAKQFFISVEGKNRALPVTQDQIPHMTRRGWRHQKATMATGEGAGLGLYIVETIMQAAGGTLQILPTRPAEPVTPKPRPLGKSPHSQFQPARTSDSVTEIRLCFGPLAAKRQQTIKAPQK
jgi:signal transduction histidine kinase